VGALSQRNPRHLHNLLNAMMATTPVWIPHFRDGWESVIMVNITRAATVTVKSRNYRGNPTEHRVKAEDVYLRKPK